MSVKKIKIDKTSDGMLYRYNVEFDDGSTHGSCFCYDSLEEALGGMCLALKINGEFKEDDYES